MKCTSAPTEPRMHKTKGLFDYLNEHTQGRSSVIPFEVSKTALKAFWSTVPSDASAYNHEHIQTEQIVNCTSRQASTQSKRMRMCVCTVCVCGAKARLSYSPHKASPVNRSAHLMWHTKGIIIARIQSRAHYNSSFATTDQKRWVCIMLRRLGFWRLNLLGMFSK